MKFSIIIPVTPNKKPEVINSLKNLNYNKKKYEIIIQEGKNPPKNRNKGAKKAKGEIFYFVDSHSIIPKNVLNQAEIFFNKYKDIDIVGGPHLTPKNDNFFAKCSGYVLSSYFATSGMYKRYNKSKLSLNANEMWLTSGNLFVKKNIFFKIGGFNTKIYPGEDPEFIDRAKYKEFKVAYYPNIFVYHRRRSNPIKMFKQFFNYGRNRLKKEKLNEKKVNLLFFIPSLFVIYLILLYPLYLINKIFIWPFYFYVLLVLISSLYISIKNYIFSIILVPFLYPLIHISYGLGILYHLIKND